MKPSRFMRSSSPPKGGAAEATVTTPTNEVDGRPQIRPPKQLLGSLGAMAVVVSAITLIVAVLAIGLVPPAPIVAHNSRGGPVTIGATCTHYSGAQVTITVSGSGTVVVRATVGVGINHTFGIRDEARIVLATASTDCSVNNATAFVSVPPSLPTDPFHFSTVPLLRAFPVSARATHVFYVNGIMAAGGDGGDRFDSASIVATFHPA